jgi:hypothetical protein
MTFISTFVWREWGKNEKPQGSWGPVELRTDYFLIANLDQWYSTWGTRRHVRGYVKLKKKFMTNTLINN